MNSNDILLVFLRAVKINEFKNLNDGIKYHKLIKAEIIDKQKLRRKINYLIENDPILLIKILQSLDENKPVIKEENNKDIFRLE